MRVWCEHMKWEGKWGWIIPTSFADIVNSGLLNYCPYCGKKRPKGFTGDLKESKEAKSE